jgi:hypothetical protein
MQVYGQVDHSYQFLKQTGIQIFFRFSAKLKALDIQRRNLFQPNGKGNGKGF